MNITGLGDSIMEDLYNFKFVKEIPDIYHLKDKKKDLIRLEGYGDKSINNLIESIEISKTLAVLLTIFFNSSTV